MPQDLTDDKSTLAQVMARCRAASHCLNQCWPKSPMPCGVTRPQCVNNSIWVIFRNMTWTGDDMVWYKLFVSLHFQAVKVLRNPELKPFIIFVKPPSLERLKETRQVGEKPSTSMSEEKESRTFTVSDLLHSLDKSMAQCKTAVTPLLMHWSYCSLALSHRNVQHAATTWSHYLNQWLLVIKCLFWHSPDNNFTRNADQLNS